MASFLEKLMEFSKNKFDPINRYPEQPNPMNDKDLDMFLVQKFGMLNPQQMALMRKAYQDAWKEERMKQQREATPLLQDKQMIFEDQGRDLRIPYRAFIPDARYFSRDQK